MMNSWMRIGKLIGFVEFFNFQVWSITKVSSQICSKSNMTEIRPRRIRPGTRYKDFYNYPSKSFEEHRQDPLGMEQWIDQNTRENGVTDPDSTITPPVNLSNEELNVWKYEQVRYFCKQLNWLSTELQGYCPPRKYPQMIATEQWIFLCAAHKTPKECAAVDYMRHTLHFVGNQLVSYAKILYTIKLVGLKFLHSRPLNDPKRFPSRSNVKDVAVVKLSNICRRVYRIFAHAYRVDFTKYMHFSTNTGWSIYNDTKS